MSELPTDVQEAIDLLADWAVEAVELTPTDRVRLRDVVAGQVTAAITDPDYEQASDGYAEDVARAKAEGYTWS